MKKETFSQKKILITGGSSGIGLAIAKELVAAGAHVWILARDLQKLTASVDLLRSKALSPHQQIGYLVADVSNPALIETVLQAFVSEHGTPDFLVNSAGVVHPGRFDELTTEQFRWMMEINFLGTVYVTHALIPGMIQRHSGHIINISSAAGFIGFYGYSAYGASKYALRGFSDVLRQEMKPLGIQVSIAFPSDTQTPQLEYEQKYKPAIARAIFGNPSPQSAESVAKEIIQGVQHRRYIITPGFEGTLIYRLHFLIGDLVYPLMDWLVNQASHKVKNNPNA